MKRFAGREGRLRAWMLMLSVAALPLLAGSMSSRAVAQDGQPQAVAVDASAGATTAAAGQAQPSAQAQPQAPSQPAPPAGGAGAETGTAEQVASAPALDEEAVRASIEQSFRNMVRVHPPSVDPTTLDSLFFTTWQYELLKEAKRGFLSRPATVTELEADPSEAPERPRGPREIGLGGIVYVNTDNWTIWLNGQRITPDAMPPEIIDLEVKREYIQVKWYDSFNNLIYPIRLRPHQRFNIDTRIFLPGAVAQSL